MLRDRAAPMSTAAFLPRTSRHSIWATLSQDDGEGSSGSDGGSSRGPPVSSARLALEGKQYPRQAHHHDRRNAQPPQAQPPWSHTGQPVVNHWSATDQTVKKGSKDGRWLRLRLQLREVMEDFALARRCTTLAPRHRPPTGNGVTCLSSHSLAIGHAAPAKRLYYHPAPPALDEDECPPASPPNPVRSMARSGLPAQQPPASFWTGLGLLVQNPVPWSTAHVDYYHLDWLGGGGAALEPAGGGGPHHRDDEETSTPPSLHPFGEPALFGQPDVGSVGALVARAHDARNGALRSVGLLPLTSV